LAKHSEVKTNLLFVQNDCILMVILLESMTANC